ncbi:T9SS type B sorting domain-containing protein [Flavobacterium jejuense]|uniref:T9SS type B sorting domain-containing protein n=1 Tax=Flavobacterium jejuense TaxID=1544455 RepID=A0ABX0INZ0_9FLAO|nr:T9SS type B sorting domain-containing protein [Flavobacterium jejuense]NHN24193.1 T9SS type B sorting domain-containing protein [Flavobacterium jejuense]
MKTEAQNETDNWYFGENAGINFGNGDVSVLTDGNMITPAGCSSISDSSGDLLFYTNGRTIWNKNHQIMDNGDNLQGDIEGVQTSIIIPKPNDPFTYYLFVTNSTPQMPVNGIFYSEIKFSPQNPLGLVTLKNIRIANDATARLAAIYHFGSNSYRLICLTKTTTAVFKFFKITTLGVDINPIIRNVNEEIESFGAMKISPNGEYLAVAANSQRIIYIYEFDNDNIDFVHYLSLNTYPRFGLGINPYGIEFSQDSNNFYYSGDNYVVQFQFTARDSMEVVDPYIISYPNAKSLQLAKNGKIYISNDEMDNDSNFLSVINKPDEYGEACNFERNVINLSSGYSKKGLPIFVSSFLRNRIIASDDDCVNTSFSFKLDAYGPIDSVEWDFGDGTFSTEFDPDHIFTSPGFQRVKATITINNETVTLYRNIEVYPLPDLEENITLTQCDTDSDGFSVFNLENIKDYLTYSNADFQFYFYTSLDNVNNEINEISNHQNYTNTTNPEEIFVKIKSDKGCSIVSSFFIENIQSVVPDIETIYVCENSDNAIGNSLGKFNLVVKKQEIINELAIPANYRISFYRNLLDAQTKLNMLDRYPILPSMTIWVRIEDENFNCFGIIPFSGVVNPELNLDIEEVYTICENTDSPIIIDGGYSNDSWQWEKLNGGILSTNRFFELSEVGNFILTVSKEENGIVCNQEKNFRVIKAPIPVLNSINADNGEISISILGMGNYMYSLDGFDYYGNGTSHTFTYLEPNNYKVYIKDENGCENIIIENVLLLKFPKFFTPNNDGINDEWRVYGPFQSNYSSAKVEIFDRYGKFIYALNLLDNQSSWNGLYNNLKLPSSDYWFKVTLTSFNGEMIEKKGHFTLKR